MSGKLSRFFQINEIRIVFIVGAISFILGIIGHYQIYFSPENKEASSFNFSYWDIFYSTLQMYILESDAETGSAQWTIYLQVARFLAPIVIIWSAFRSTVRIDSLDSSIFCTYSRIRIHCKGAL